jgi:hypothetical protein
MHHLCLVHTLARLGLGVGSIWKLAWVKTLLLKERFVVPESINQYLALHTFAFQFRCLQRVEDTVHVVLDTSTTRSLSVALDLSISTPDTGEHRSAGSP